MAILRASVHAFVWTHIFIYSMYLAVELVRGLVHSVTTGGLAMLLSTAVILCHDLISSV